MVLLSVSVASAQSFEQTPLVVGQAATQVVTGADPGDAVWFVASLQGQGQGPCFGPEPDDCLGLAPPLQVLGVQTADAAGVAVNPLLVPVGAPLVPVATQAMRVSGPVGARTFAALPAITAPIQPLSSLSDDFASGALDERWSVLHPELADVAVVGGALRVTPLVTSPSQYWYQDGEGVLVWQELRGDFVVTTRAFAHAAGSADPPATPYRLGGLTVRNPLDTAAGTHDFVHLAVGAGDAAHPYAVEHKTTVDSVSSFAFVSVPHEPIDLRIARTGASFAMSYKRAADAAWTPVATYVQPQLPDTVQVGLMAYGTRAPIDLEVDFEDFVLAP